MSKNDGLQVPARPRRTVPESGQIARDRKDWVATGTRPEPAKEKRVRMTFRVSQALQSASSCGRPERRGTSDVLCALMEQYVEAQDMSPATIRRALARSKPRARRACQVPGGRDDPAGQRSRLAEPRCCHGLSRPDPLPLAIMPGAGATRPGRVVRASGRLAVHGHDPVPQHRGQRLHPRRKAGFPLGRLQQAEDRSAVNCAA